MLKLFFVATIMGTHPPGLHISSDVSPTSQPQCPKVSRRGNAPLLDAVTSHALFKFNRLKLNRLTRGDIQPLEDPSVCDRLDDFYKGSMYGKGKWRREYFQTGGYYMAEVYYKGNNKHDVQRGHIAVFSGKLRLVGLVDNPKPGPR
jgi:hypothetical protein